MEAFRVAEYDAYLRYHDLPGEDPVFVFLHGLGSASSADFPEIARHSRLREHRALLLDVLGHGFSDRPAEFDYSMESQADFVARLLRELGLRQTIVVGHSMGGSIAVLLAARAPDLVSHVFSAEGNLDPGPGFVSGRITAMSEEAFVTSGHGAFVKTIVQAGFSDYAGAVRAADPVGLYRSAASLIARRSPTYREHLAALVIPRTYVFGEQTLPDPDTDRLAEIGVDVCIVPDAGHGMMIDNPDGFATVVADAVEQAH
jgi:pimeloyl-ACP methyl ester carboxylesterase